MNSDNVSLLKGENRKPVIFSIVLFKVNYSNGLEIQLISTIAAGDKCSDNYINNENNVIFVKYIL